MTHFFKEFGDILESQIIRDNKSGQHKGCAFVKFASMSSAERAMEELQGKAVEGVDLRVKF